MVQAAAQAISNIKFDKVIVWEGGGANGNGHGCGRRRNFLQNMAKVMPPMMQVMKDIGGVEMPEYLARFARRARPSAEDGGQRRRGAGAAEGIGAVGGTISSLPRLLLVPKQEFGNEEQTRQRGNPLRR